jgi:hypothetical protein
VHRGGAGLSLTLQGDGVGPEIMRSALDILRAVGAPLETEEIVVGEQVDCCSVGWIGGWVGVGCRVCAAHHESRVSVLCGVVGVVGVGYVLRLAGPSLLMSLVALDEHRVY